MLALCAIIAADRGRWTPAELITATRSADAVYSGRTVSVYNLQMQSAITTANVIAMLSEKIKRRAQAAPPAVASAGALEKREKLQLLRIKKVCAQLYVHEVCGQNSRARSRLLCVCFFSFFAIKATYRDTERAALQSF